MFLQCFHAVPVTGIGVLAYTFALSIGHMQTYLRSVRIVPTFEIPATLLLATVENVYVSKCSLFIGP